MRCGKQKAAPPAISQPSKVLVIPLFNAADSMAAQSADMVMYIDRLNVEPLEN
jgi:hypothetical protein